MELSNIYNDDKSSHSNNSAGSSLYMDMIPFNLRGRAEWWELQREEITICEKIAEGSNGIINKVKWRGEICVVKYLKHNNNETEYDDLINEVNKKNYFSRINLNFFF